MELLTPRPPSDTPRTPNTLRDSADLQTSECAQVPEPLGNEIILSAQQDLPARRKNAPFKAIQIINPRPLPSKKTHSNLSERPNLLTSPHLFSSISSDHDYCGPADHFLAHIPQCVRYSKSKDSSKITESLPNINDPECKQQTSPGGVVTSVTTTDIPSSGSQHLPVESRNGPETSPSTDMLLTLSHSIATEPTCNSAAKHKVVPCTLPTPPPSPLARGRDRRRHQRSSPRSDSSSSSCSSSPSSSSSCSPSPKRQIYYFNIQYVWFFFSFGPVLLTKFIHPTGGDTNIQRVVPVHLPRLARFPSPLRSATGGPAPEGDAAGPDRDPGPSPGPRHDRRPLVITAGNGEMFTSQLMMQACPV